MRTVQTPDGRPAIADDMPPGARAVLFLVQHANLRRAESLPLPCPCVECIGHRGTVQCSVAPDGRTLVIEFVPEDRR